MNFRVLSAFFLIFVTGCKESSPEKVPVTSELASHSELKATPQPENLPLCSSPAGQSSDSFAAGDGSSTNPFLICNLNQLKLVGNPDYVSGNYSFKLLNDIDASGLTSSFTGDNLGVFFQGKFDGASFAIKLGTIQRGHFTEPVEAGNSDLAGLFGQMNGAEVKNLTVLVDNMDRGPNDGLGITKSAGILSSYCAHSTFENIAIKGNISIGNPLCGKATHINAKKIYYSGKTSSFYGGALVGLLSDPSYIDIYEPGSPVTYSNSVFEQIVVGPDSEIIGYAHLGGMIGYADLGEFGNRNPSTGSLLTISDSLIDGAKFALSNPLATSNMGIGGFVGVAYRGRVDVNRSVMIYGTYPPSSGYSNRFFGFAIGLFDTVQSQPRNLATAVRLNGDESASTNYFLVPPSIPADSTADTIAGFDVRSRASISFNIAEKIIYQVGSGSESDLPQLVFPDPWIFVTQTSRPSLAFLAVLVPPPAIQAPTAISYSFPELYKNLAINSPILPVVSGGTPSNFQIKAGSLPSGLSLSSTTGEITGTPTATTILAGQSVTIRASNSSGSAERQLNIRVLANCPAPSVTYSPYFYDLTQGSPVDISPNTAPTGGANLELSAPLPTGLSFSSTTGKITGNPQATIQATTFQVILTSGIGCKGYSRFDLSVKAPAAPSGLSYTVPEVYKNLTLRNPIVPTLQSGTPTNFSIVGGSLPLGLVLNSSTGAITGTPSKTTIFSGQSVSIRASNLGGSTQSQFSIRVLESCPKPSVQYSPTPYVLTVGVATDITPSSGPFQTEGLELNMPLPSGLVYNSSTGKITGTPEVVSPNTIYQVTLTSPIGCRNYSRFDLEVK